MCFINFNAVNNTTDLTKFGNDNLKELVLHCVAHGSFTSLEGFFPKLEIFAPPAVKVLSDTKHNIETMNFQGCVALQTATSMVYSWRFLKNVC